MRAVTLSRSPNGLPAFLLVWLGQFASLLGSGLTEFALGVWVYQRTGSTTQFALTFLFLALPRVLLSPFAGALIDRWDRRWTMLLSDLGAGMTTVALATLFSMRWRRWLSMCSSRCLLRRAPGPTASGGSWAWGRGAGSA